MRGQAGGEVSGKALFGKGRRGGGGKMRTSFLSNNPAFASICQCKLIPQWPELNSKLSMMVSFEPTSTVFSWSL